jgi:hypothetical protein
MLIYLQTCGVRSATLIENTMHERTHIAAPIKCAKCMFTCHFADSMDRHICDTHKDNNNESTSKHGQRNAKTSQSRAKLMVPHKSQPITTTNRQLDCENECDIQTMDGLDRIELCEDVMQYKAEQQNKRIITNQFACTKCTRKYTNKQSLYMHMKYPNVTP